MTNQEALKRVISTVDLPFMYITTYGDGQGYAVTLRGVRYGVDRWCHPVDGSFPWHRTEDEAWACCDQNHPGLREALEIVTKLLEVTESEDKHD